MNYAVICDEILYFYLVYTILEVLGSQRYVAYPKFMDLLVNIVLLIGQAS